MCCVFTSCVVFALLLFFVFTIFKAPNSYTGEDIVEISTHGNPYIVEEVIKKCLDSGAKIAKPGEFTLRAFLNNKLSLDQSEAVIEIINANSKASLKAAQNSLEGGLKVKISAIQDKLRETRVLVETLIDFADEDVNVYIEEVTSKINEFKLFFASFNEDMKAYSSISNDVKVVVIGPPNSGKSTLINAIIGKKVSIVNEKQGTTRDVVTSSCLIDGIRFVFSDTAGIRKTLDNKLCSKFKQNGGFFYDQNDDFILQVLDTIDFIFDIINILPNHFFNTHTQFITLPYMILSFYSNLLRKNHEMAFYTLIGIIPGIGSLISTSSKIILRIIKYNQKIKENNEKLDKLNQIKTAKEIKKILKSKYSNSFNYPFLSDFENNYD